MQLPEDPYCSQTPHEDVLVYARRKRIALASDIKSRTKVYLDTKFWVMLRDVRLGRSGCEDTKNLLTLLESSVREGAVICPFNPDIYSEVLKQNDESTLVATAELVDDLSLGICLLPSPEVQDLEFLHFVKSCTKETRALHELDELVWSKTAYVLGFITPHSHALPADENLAMQKGFVDHLWTLGFADMLDVIGPGVAAAKQSPFRDISSDLNKGKFEHLDDHSSFKSLFLSEIRGGLDACREDLSSLFIYVFEQRTGRPAGSVERKDDTAGEQLANLIYCAFREGRITSQLPTLRVHAGLHAALRWDRNRKYKPGDMFDFKHAAAALPYCDVFLTERSLHHLLKDGNLRFDEQFTCKIESTSADAVALLSKDY